VLISYIKGLLASSWLGKLMPLINIPSKSARRGTREPELHSAKAAGGTRRRRGGSRRNIIGTTLSPLSAETEQEPRGILHFAPPPSLRLGSAASAPFAWRIAERSFHSNFRAGSRSRRSRNSPFASSSKTREAREGTRFDKTEPLPEGTKRPRPREADYARIQAETEQTRLI